MFPRVLFPTDFSMYANSVLACIPELKAAGAQIVVLLYVIRDSDVPMADTINWDSLDRVRKSAERQLFLARKFLEGAGLRVVTRIEYGHPVEQILRVSEEEGVGLIVIGAQGQTLAAELLLGSVSYEVVRRAKVPVLVYKFHIIQRLEHAECQRVCASTFRRIVHPTDFSEYSERAFQIVKRLKNAGVEEVILLHVQDSRVMRHRPAEQIAEFDKADQERLEQMSRALALFGIASRVLLRHGLPAEETLKVAEEEDVGAIVLGARGRTLWREMLVGSTLESVIRLSSRPVLVVR
ncbi:MAG: universal stress protein [Anaerolineae bacterium]